ncbi:MAG: hypothetical protein NTU95_04230 [Methanothrix sp.]|nr:hypothetical protein [Methanothrix sp.]
MRMRDIIPLCCLLLSLTIALIPGEDVAPGQPLLGDLVLKAEAVENPVLEISVEESDESIWKLVPSPANKKEIQVQVKADGPWQLIVTDNNSLTAGHMTEWTGLAYTDKHIISPLKAVGSIAIPLPNPEKIPLREGTATLSGALPLKVGLEQEVSLNDEPLASGHIYRIELTITLSAE